MGWTLVIQDLGTGGAAPSSPRDIGTGGGAFQWIKAVAIGGAPLHLARVRF